MAAIQTATILDEVLDFLTSAPTPQQIADFRISEGLQERVRYLLDTNRNGPLTAEENAEMEELSRLNHFMILLKARAHQKLLEHDLHS